jgi:phenol hydroxylase P1 protein
VQIELRTQVIEPRRRTFTNLAERFGDRPASRYEEGTIDVQATENFHYRPLWGPTRWQYDPEYSALRLTDPYSFTDPRQLYYAPYVQSRSSMQEAFSKSLDYLESRSLLGRMPEAWQQLVANVLLPLRHYEAGAQLITTEGVRFCYGTTIDACCTFAAFDRIGNAQQLSRVGIVLSGGSAELLGAAKQAWLEAPALQGLRRLEEELLTERDWGTELVTLDLADRLVYGLMYQFLDEAALLGGAGAYSLIAQHLNTWFADQRRWIDALIATWLADPEVADANRAALDAVLAARWGQVVEAVSDLAAAVDAHVGVGAVDAARSNAAAVAAGLTALGLTVPEVSA